MKLTGKKLFARILPLLLALFLMQAAVAAPSAVNASSGAAAAAPDKPDKLDINAATADQLKAVLGVDDAHAQKIIAGRPYRTKLDLVHKKLISQAIYDKVKDQIIAHQPKPGAATPAAPK